MSTVALALDNPHPKHWAPVNRLKIACPICGKLDRCTIAPDGRWAWCFRDPDGKGRGAGARYQLTGDRPAIAPRPPRQRYPSNEIADPDTLDAVYSALLNLLDLSPTHREQLHARGLTDEQIARHGYRSLPEAPGGRQPLVGQLLRTFPGTILAHVPGVFVRLHRGRQAGALDLAGAAGMLIPVRDPRGRIIRLRIRRDAGDGGKYRWLSSDGRPGGTAAPAAIHVARPAEVQDARVYVVEGEIKANIAADRLGAVVVSVPGVSIWRPALAILDELDAAEVGVAYDADLFVKPDVRRHRDAFADELAAAGFAVDLVEWDLAQGKGLDDYLTAGHPLTDANLTTWQPRHRIRSVDAAAMADRFPAPPRLFPLAEARAGIRAALDAALWAPAPVQIAITSTPGAGKTQAAYEAIAAFAANPPTRITKTGERVPPRIALVVQTNEAANAAIAALPGAVYLGGRVNPDALKRAEDPASFGPSPDARVCYHFHEAQAAGRKRHVSLDCLGDDTYPPCPHRDADEAARRAPLVVAQASKLIHNLDILAGFHAVIWDEKLTDYLRFTLTLQRPRAAEHAGDHDYAGSLAEHRRCLQFFPDRYPLGCPTRQLIDLLEDCFHESLDADRSVPLVPVLQRRAAALGVDLRSLIGTLRDQYRNQLPGETPPPGAPVVKRGVLDIEQFHRDEDGKGIRPLVCLVDTVAAIAADLETDPRNARAYLTAAGIEVQCFRDKAIRALRHKRLVNLDATPPAELGRFFPKLERVDFPIAEHVELIQFTDRLYSAQQIAQPELAERINRRLAMEVGAGVILTHKSADPAAAKDGAPALAVPGATTGHFGLDDRATNAFQDCDWLAIVGHPLPPADPIRRRVQALRGWLGDPAPPLSTEETTYRPYNWRDAAGSGLAYRRRCDPDPDVQAALDDALDANLRQAIGRLRPALRSPDAPARVLLFCADPTDYPVSALTTLAEELADTATRTVPAGFAEHNDLRADRARAVLAAALAAYPHAGRNELARLTRLSPLTVSKYLAFQSTPNPERFTPPGSHPERSQYIYRDACDPPGVNPLPEPLPPDDQPDRWEVQDLLDRWNELGKPAIPRLAGPPIGNLVRWIDWEAPRPGDWSAVRRALARPSVAGGLPRGEP